MKKDVEAEIRAELQRMADEGLIEISYDENGEEIWKATDKGDEWPGDNLADNLSAAIAYLDAAITNSPRPALKAAMTLLESVQRDVDVEDN